MQLSNRGGIRLLRQARIHLGTPGGVKSFARGAKIFWTMSNSFNLCPTHFSRGEKNFLGGASHPWLRACFRARVKIAESCPKTLYNLWNVICAIYGLEKRPVAPMFVHVTSKRAPIFYTCYTKILLAESNLNFYFVWKFASAWKYISHCKLFEVIWLYIVLCLHIKVVKEPPLSHIFALFWKTYDLLQCLRLQSSSSAFKQNNAKTKCESLKEGPPETTALFAFPNIDPCSQLLYIQKKELAPFYNTNELIVLCSVIKVFFNHYSPLG